MQKIEMYTQAQHIELNHLLNCEVDYKTEFKQQEECNLCELHDTTGNISFLITQDNYGYLNVYRRINGKYFAILGSYADCIAEKYSN